MTDKYVDTHLIDLFLSESELSKKTFKNSLEKTAEYGRLLSKYETSILNTIKILAERLENLQSTHGIATKQLTEEITQDDEFTLIKKDKPKKKIEVNLFGKYVDLPRFTPKMHDSKMYYCPKRKLIIYKIFDQLFYFSPPTSYNTIEYTVDCNADYCKKYPDKSCKFHHRAEYYGTYISSKNYISIYLPKPLGQFNSEVISDCLINNKKLTSDQYNVLKDYTAFMILACVLLN